MNRSSSLDVPMGAELDNAFRRFVRPPSFASSHGDLRSLRSQLRYIASALPTILDDIVSSKQSIELIASRSFKHTNGFFKIVLHGSSLHEIKLRLHFWPTGSATHTDADPHNHRWTFLSVPLFGALYEERYRVAAENGHREMHELACSPRSSERIKVTS